MVSIVPFSKRKLTVKSITFRHTPGVDDIFVQGRFFIDIGAKGSVGRNEAGRIRRTWQGRFHQLSVEGPGRRTLIGIPYDITIPNRP